MLKFLVVLLVASSAYSTDCLRFMGNNTKLKWSTSCNVIQEDSSKKQVHSIDACFGKYEYRGKNYIVFNSDLTLSSGLSDAIITNGALGIKAHENTDFIALNIQTYSPELFQRAKHSLSFDKKTKSLKIKTFKGTFKLKKKFDLVLSCD